MAGISFGVYCVIGMDHDDDVGPLLQGQPVAAFLIPAVAKIFGMGKNDGPG